ncbi:MAG: hypothetical protein QOG74_3693, partial [Alphaproteobacteria bacterium]|nr:hypothetical protein [Alphaproteobacteria bacterium]
SLPAQAGNPVTTAVSERALRFHRSDTEYWMLSWSLSSDGAKHRSGDGA